LLLCLAPTGVMKLRLWFHDSSTLAGSSESLSSRVLQYRKLHGRTFENFEGADYWYDPLHFCVLGEA
jgi:hypothetical protein